MERANRLKNIKVGVAAVFALVLVAVAYWMVGSLRLSGKTYDMQVVFRDVQGIAAGAPVMMAGVRIGSVQKISLTPASRALVELRINQDCRIPAGSLVRISSVSLLGDRFVEFLPGPPGGKKLRPGRTLQGTEATSLDDLLGRVSNVLDRMDSVGQSVQSLLTDRRLRDGLHATVDNLNAATASAALLVRHIDSITGANEGAVRTVAANLTLATQKMASAADQIDALLRGGNKDDVRQIFSNLKDASSRLDTAAANAASLSGDPDIRRDLKETVGDLKETIRNAREATEGAKAVVAQIGKTVGIGKAPTQPKPPVPKPPSGTGGQVDMLLNTDRGEVRVDANYTLQLRPNKFYRVGLYDLGEDTKLNLQAGRVQGNGRAVRAGLYQSRLGLGYDWQADDRWMIQGDLYRPNRLRADLKGRIGLTDDLWGWIGVEDIGGSNAPVAGVQLKF